MSDQVTLTLPDGSTRDYPRGITGGEVAVSIGRGLAKAAVAAKVDGEVVDLGAPIERDAPVAIVTADSDDGREVLRHSAAHLMAQAVFDLFPGAKYAIGPAIADGFYYDFELPDGARFTDDDLARIEARMREIVKEDQVFTREELDREAALELFADQPYKLEIIERARAGQASDDDAVDIVEAGVISVYRNLRDGDDVAYVDLCRGPHVPSTGKVGAFKLQKLAGAYWRGDEKRPMLQRIYGTAWESKAALAEHLHQLEEAERRDHRKLGLELDLFSFPEELGAGLAVWHPKGAEVRSIMEDFSRAEHEEAGYQLVYTPHIAKSVLWETSGHLGFYAAGMYPPIEVEGADYYVKPMNCPFHILIYRSHLRSYRELPMKLFELGAVYRFERSGVLHGLLRARGFTQDDSHIFCEPQQIVPVLSDLLDFVLRILRTFGFEEFEADVSTRPDEKSVGADADWKLATDALFEAIEGSGIEYKVAEGEGAFYGPKIDIHVRDAIGRRWQVSTLQVDFQMPQRFELAYVGADNERHEPIMIHRALFGSVERFFGILVEHYAGAFPTWLAPVQVVVLPVADRHHAYAFRVADRLKAEGARVDLVDAHADTLGARVRDAKLQKVPYVLVTGDDDAEHGTVGVNRRGSEQAERGVKLDAFTAELAGATRERG
ncbi:MAG TPA: threonine--tRNA ligase [Acidimicrobiia bacterium]